MSDDRGDDGQPSGSLAAHLAGAAAAVLVGIVGFIWILAEIAEGGVTIPGLLIGGVFLMTAILGGAFAFYRALGQVLPSACLGLADPEPLGHFRRLDFVRVTVGGDPDAVATYLDDLRGLDAPDVRPWQPGADVPDEVGQAAYQDAQELQGTIQRQLRLRVGLAAAAIAMGLVVMVFLFRPIELALGAIGTGIFFVLVMVGPPFLIVLSLLPATVRDWTLWYRDHVVEG